MDTPLESPYGHWDISFVGEFDPQEFWGFVYEITQKSTGKSYIGRKQFKFKRQKTKSDKSRTKESDWREYNSSSELVQSLIEELGSSDFEFKILKLCSGKCELNYEEESVQRERDVLRARLPNGELRFYNRTIGYKNFGGLEKQSEETRAKMRVAWTPERRAALAARSSQPRSEVTKAKLRVVNLGKKLSEETKQKLSVSNIGRIHTDESKEKIRQRHLGRTASPEAKENMKRAWTDERRAEVAEANKTRMTPEVREHCRQAKLGIPLSDEHKAALSESHKGIVQSDEWKYARIAAAATTRLEQKLRWWTDGSISKLSHDCPAEGWYLGRTFNPHAPK